MDDESRRPALSAGRLPLEAESRPLASVPDDVLLRRLGEILGQSRRVETDLIAHIGEADERRIYAREAFPSMFACCTEALHLSEGEAYLRIAVARASREHPMLLPMLGDGRLHLSAIALLAPHITRPATLTPTPSVAVSSASAVEPTPSGMGRTVTPSMAHPPAVSPGASSSSGSPTTGSRRSPPVLEPLALGRYKVQFTATAGLHEKLQRLRALMRSQVPDGDLGAVIEAAVTEKLERLEARRFATTGRPRKDLSTTDTSPSSRRIPAAVRRAVRERDGGRCRYVDTSGRRCDERQRLECHHLHPFGMGGDHRPENVCLMCVQHNACLAEQDYGREAMARFRRSGRPGTLASSGTPSRVPGVAAVASGIAGGPPGVAPSGS